ncbi:hypothetical protein B296_00000875 [Ensete ventricosum]|uniref:Uncharacterized protein n=1 Tax=Ensete ventricosum TaxID=4639 RepID=A0A426ZGM2_ENSVE|nr:hypothetical protein B296_00000875 [Ensete ventricosum]
MDWLGGLVPEKGRWLKAKGYSRLLFAVVADGYVLRLEGWLRVAVNGINRFGIIDIRKLWIYSKRSEDRGQPAMARPFVGVADHDQAPCRGDRQWPSPPIKGRPPIGIRKEQMPIASPQGAAANDQPARGGPSDQGYC